MWAPTIDHAFLRFLFLFTDGTRVASSSLLSRLMPPQAMKKGIFLDATDYLVLYVFRV